VIFEVGNPSCIFGFGKDIEGYFTKGGKFVFLEKGLVRYQKI
jgi:hypothetical protein